MTKKRSKVRPATPQMHQDVKAAIDILVRTCNKYGLAACGFVYGITTPLLLYNFGNTKQAKDIETYEKLVRLADTRRMLGMVQHTTPEKVN